MNDDIRLKKVASSSLEPVSESNKLQARERAPNFAEFTSTLQRSEPHEMVVALAANLPTLEPAERGLKISSEKAIASQIKEIKGEALQNNSSQIALPQVDETVEAIKTILQEAASSQLVIDKLTIQSILSGLAIEMLLKKEGKELTENNLAQVVKEGVESKNIAIKEFAQILNRDFPQGITKGDFHHLISFIRGNDVLPFAKLAIDHAKKDVVTSTFEAYLSNLKTFSTRLNESDMLKWVETVDVSTLKNSKEYYAYLLVSALKEHGSGEGPFIDKFKQLFNSWLIEPLNEKMGKAESVKELVDGYPSSSFISGCVSCGADLVNSSIGALGLALHAKVDENPIADVVYALAPPSQIPIDTLAAVSLLAALLYNGGSYKAINDTLKQAAGGKPPIDLDFVIQFAKNMIVIIKTSDKRDADLKGKALAENNFIRLILSTMTLNMLYRAAYGGMTTEEFISLLEGKTQGLIEKVKNLLITLTDCVKRYLPKEGAARQESVERLYDYVESKQAFEGMLKTTRVLARLLESGDLSQKIREFQTS